VRFGVHLIDPLHKHYHMTCALRLNARPQQSIGSLEFAPAAQLTLMAMLPTLTAIVLTTAGTSAHTQALVKQVRRHLLL
jgi:hypothetical protein